MQLPQLVPELSVVSLKRSLEFYIGLLGFSIEYERPEDTFAMISLEGSWMMLEETSAFEAVTKEEFVNNRAWRTGKLEYPFGRGINFQIVVSNVEEKYRSITKARYEVKVPLEKKSYRANAEEIHVKQFLMMDPDGYLLRLQQRIE